MTYRIAVLGGVNRDRVVVVPGPLPEVDGTAYAADVQDFAGGHAGNTAAALARLGGRPFLVGAVGDDAAGRWLAATAEGSGIDTELLEVTSAKTGEAIVLISGQEQRMLVYSGAAASWNLGEPATARIGRVDGIVVCDVAPEEAYRAMVACAGTRVYSPGGSVTKFPPDRLAKAAAEADVFVCNETEASWLVDGGEPEPLRRLLGSRAVVVTRGEDGATAADATATCRIASHALAFMSSLGAGDAFTAACALALVSGRSLPDAVTAGCAAGALATTELSAQGGAWTAREVWTLLKVEHAPWW